MCDLYNHKRMGLNDAMLIGRGHTVKKGQMFCDEVIPFVNFLEERAQIKGEVFKVDEDTLKMLDSLEIPYGYDREENVEIQLSEDKNGNPSSEIINVKMYTYNDMEDLIRWKKAVLFECADYRAYIETLDDETKASIQANKKKKRNHKK